MSSTNGQELGGGMEVKIIKINCMNVLKELIKYLKHYKNPVQAFFPNGCLNFKFTLQILFIIFTSFF